jgi:DNA polymerase III delta prime subunit
MDDNYLWCETYRPRKISECVLPDRLKETFQEYVNTENVPNLMLTGTSGVGKTTVARAMCEEIGLNYLFINSSEERGIDTLRNKIVTYASTVSLTGGRKVIILDEADNITPDAQLALRGAIEQFARNCSFILTCNYKAKVIEAIHSRCSVIDFTLKADEKPKMAAQFYKKAVQMLADQSIRYEAPAVVAMINKFFPDYRRIVNELQRHSVKGVIDETILAQIADTRNMAELVSSLKNKDYSAMRKWVGTNSDIDPSRIYRKIYDGLYQIMKPKSIPQAAVILARYMYQAAFVSDQEVNLVACLTEIMVDCEFN